MHLIKNIRVMVAMLMLVAIMMTLCACRSSKTDTTTPTTVDPSTTKPLEPDPTFSTQPNTNDMSQTAFLGDNLYITEIAKYTGAYMEDGSNEYVTDVMMVVLKNEGTSDLQLARINLVYADFTASFEVTNLPAGESAILLEKNRHTYVEEFYLQAKPENVIFFQEPMGLQESKVKVTGGKREITVENISDETLGQIYVYYKNSAEDLFYGGITYRSPVAAGLKPGESATIIANHYYETATTIIFVDIQPVAE